MSNLNITPDNARITIKESNKVRINTNICIYGTGNELPVTIEADFTNVPHHLHQVYLQSLIYKYK